MTHPPDGVCYLANERSRAFVPDRGSLWPRYGDGELRAAEAVHAVVPGTVPSGAHDVPGIRIMVGRLLAADGKLPAGTMALPVR
jgi:hypothetical protein